MARADEQRRAWRADGIARQRAVVERLADHARAAGDDAEGCLAWLGVERQARRTLASLRRRPSDQVGQTAGHESAVEALGEEARARLAGCDPGTVTEARNRLGVRLAVVGKGGVGKTLLSATLARLLARRGRSVLAADLDTNPGLTLSLGMPADAGALPPEAVEAHDGAPYGWRLRSGLTPDEAVRAYATVGPDNVRTLGFGKISDTTNEAPRRTVMAYREILAGFGEPGWDVVGDLEAGPTTPFERYHAFADRALLVVTPTWASAMTARRLRPVLDDVPVSIVGNRFGDEPAHPGASPEVRIPFDPDAAEAERRGVAALDACPDSPTVTAIAGLVDRLVTQEVPA